MPTLDLPHHLDCTACKLRATCNGVVPGTGALDAPLMFVGEAPGAMEDQEHAPFVGPAGTLLRGLVDSMPNMPASDQCFYSNVYHCRPPGNDIARAKGSPCPSIWLSAEITRLRTQGNLKVVVAVGQTACNFFRPGDVDMPMRWHAAKDSYDDKRKVWIIGMRHPAAALHASQDIEESNRIVTSMIWSLTRAGYYLAGTGWHGGNVEDVPEITEAFDEGGVS